MSNLPKGPDGVGSKATCQWHPPGTARKERTLSKGLVLAEGVESNLLGGVAGGRGSYYPLTHIEYDIHMTSFVGAVLTCGDS